VKMLNIGTWRLLQVNRLWTYMYAILNCDATSRRYDTTGQRNFNMHWKAEEWSAQSSTGNHWLPVLDWADHSSAFQYMLTNYAQDKNIKKKLKQKSW